MLKFYHGPQLEYLADQLLEELDQHPPENLLEPEIFVVQNHGIGQWLSLYMAEKKGIAANLEFEFPSERLWKLIRMMDDEIPENLPSDRGPMTWSLMQLLQDEQVLSDFEDLRYYIEDADPGRQAFRSWKLSSKIADVFDQYLIYRPEMVMGWQDRKLASSNPQAEKWQMRLWNALVEHWQQTYEGKWLHRAELQQELIKAIDEERFNPKELPPRIFVFGVSAMPPAIIKTLVRLSNQVDVHFYQLTVDPEVQEREAFANPLLQSLGNEQAELSAQISTYDGGRQVMVPGEERTEESVLQTIQSDLQHDANPSARNLSVPALDRSVQVHSCHSPMREVEVLYDQLLALLDDNPSLNPDDILIMTPDIETYAPMIEAVFESPDEGQPEIPYSIADRGIKGTQPAIEVFSKILELCESRFKVMDVMDLLDANPIQEAFGFTDDDLNQLERWIRDNRVRWGIDGAFKDRMDLPASDSFTWQSGLNRIMLGYVMKPDEEEQLFDELYPYEEIETTDNAELAGRFSHFLEELFGLFQALKEPRTPEEWCRKLEKIPNTFLPDNRSYFREVSTIRKAISQLPELTKLGGFDCEVPFAIVRSWLEEQLQRQSTGGGRIGRGIIFSSLMPMRSIPFQMIGMIGMNEGAFPHSSIPIEFDLLHLDPQPGDPAQADEDRNLFLENLLSARQCLYFSYEGQSNRQDTDFPPSVVLREFMDYLQQYYDISTDDLITEHRLQAFSPDYFKSDDLFSYSQTQQKISRCLADGRQGQVPFMKADLPEPEADWKQISINELVSFFQHPAKFLLQNRLGIYLGEEEVLTDEREPFELGGLDKYQVGQELLDRQLKELPLDEYQQHLQARDMLPEGWNGDRAFQQRKREVEEFCEHLERLLADQPVDDREVDMTLNGFRIVGRLSDLYKTARMTFRFGYMRPKDVVDLWIKHLCFQEVKPEGHPGISRLFTRHKKQDFAAYVLGAVDDHRDILEQLLNTYWQGLQQCCYFFPEASFTYAEEVCFKNGQPESGLYKARKNWIHDYRDYPGEGEDPYNKLLLGGEKPLTKGQFTQVSERFWAPFFDAIIQNGGS